MHVSAGVVSQAGSGEAPSLSSHRLSQPIWPVNSCGKRSLNYVRIPVRMGLIHAFSLRQVLDAESLNYLATGLTLLQHTRRIKEGLGP
jgi:hypothetical protein